MGNQQFTEETIKKNIKLTLGDLSQKHFDLLTEILIKEDCEIADTFSENIAFFIEDSTVKDNTIDATIASDICWKVFLMGYNLAKLNYKGGNK